MDSPAEHKGGNGVVAIGAALACAAVALGAFGTHGLRGHIGSAELGWWQTAVDYQMWHGLGVLALGFGNRPWARLPAMLLAAGAVIFSATLYAMALGAPHWLGAVTPLGGLAMIGGWALLAWRASRRS